MKTKDLLAANPNLVQKSTELVSETPNHIFIVKAGQKRSILGTMVKTFIAMTVTKAIVSYVVEQAVDHYISKHEDEIYEEIQKRSKKSEEDD